MADTLISTGKTISGILEEDMIVACCVINEKSAATFDKQLYTIRVSKNFFVGEKVCKQEGCIGPDTTMRLFNQI